MTARRRFLLRVAGCAGAMLAGLRAQTAPPPAPGLTPEVAALIAALPAWSAIASVETGLGYKENLLLSHAGDENSGFVRTGLNASASRLRLGDRTDYSFGLMAEGSWYFSGTSVNHDAKAYGLAKWRYHRDELLTLSLDLQGYYLDQVFDVSDTDVQRVIAQLKVFGVVAGPTLRWRFVPWFWVEVRAVGERASYQDSVFNHDIADGSVRLGWQPGGHFELSVSGGQRMRDYDDHPDYSVSGRALDGTRLKITEREAELRAKVTWDAAGRWKTTTRGGPCVFHDNGSGYFNYRERKIAQDLDWTLGGWLVHAEGEAKHLLYDVQTVGLGLNPPARVKEEYNAQFRVERKLGERWTLYAEYNWERSRCNDSVASYKMNEGLLGVRWNWEK